MGTIHQALSEQCVQVLTILSSTKNDKKLETLPALVSGSSFYFIYTTNFLRISPVVPPEES